MDTAPVWNKLLSYDSVREGIVSFSTDSPRLINESLWRVFQLYWPEEWLLRVLHRSLIVVCEVQPFAYVTHHKRSLWYFMPEPIVLTSAALFGYRKTSRSVVTRSMCHPAPPQLLLRQLSKSSNRSASTRWEAVHWGNNGKWWFLASRRTLRAGKAACSFPGSQDPPGTTLLCFKKRQRRKCVAPGVEWQRAVQPRTRGWFFHPSHLVPQGICAPPPDIPRYATVCEGNATGATSNYLCPEFLFYSLFSFLLLSATRHFLFFHFIYLLLPLFSCLPLADFRKEQCMEMYPCSLLSFLLGMLSYKCCKLWEK